MGLSLNIIHVHDDGGNDWLPCSGKWVDLPWILCDVKNHGDLTLKQIEQRGIHPNFKNQYYCDDSNYFGFNWCTVKEFKEVFPDFDLKVELKDTDILQFCCDC